MVAKPHVLIVDDEESLRHMLQLALAREGFEISTAASGQEALSRMAQSPRPDICVTDIRMPGMTGLELMREAFRNQSNPPVFVAMSAYGDENLALEALRHGAADYLSKPFKPEDFRLKLALVWERARPQREHASPGPQSSPTSDNPDRLSGMVTASESMRRVFRLVRKVAPFPTTVLITGETGTGKERIAKALHEEGTRRNGPFVPVNCGAIPENLLESELFGHVKGAFTDADTDRLGLFQMADGGTLFLDEVAELPVHLQVKLLRVLVEDEVRRLGDSQNTPIDVRVVAATSRDIDSMARSERFRPDLYFRLNVVRIHLPPLRERTEDIALLSHVLAESIGGRLGIPDARLSASCVQALEAHTWPGNVRELENVVERALVLEEGQGPIQQVAIDAHFSRNGASNLPPDSSPAEEEIRYRFDDPRTLALARVLSSVEQQTIKTVLAFTGGHRKQAAQILGISERTLLYKLKEHNL
jgi:two-component system, NtrC family, response regulator AtoC